MSGSPQTNTKTINTIITRLSSSKFTDSVKFEKLAQVENALSGQKEHLTKIKELRAKINDNTSVNITKFTNSGTAESIIKKYLKFIDYIIALIEAKIAKDEAMTVLLNNTFTGVNSFITMLNNSRENLMSKNKTEKILQNIGITDNDLKFKISNLGLKDEEKPEGITNTVDKGNIVDLVTKIIKNCQTKLTESINGFTRQLDTIIKEKSKTGGDGNPNTSPNGSFKNLSNANLIVPDGDNLNKYQKQFKDIKENYEKGLKDNIIAYRAICKILLSEEQNSPGILKIIIDSVNKLSVVNKEITKKYGFKLGIFQTEPFAANKIAFNALKNEINAAKSELSVSPSTPPSTVVPPSVTSNYMGDSETSDSETSDSDDNSEYKHALNTPGQNRTRVPYIENLTAQDLGTNSRGLGALQETLYNPDFNKLVNAALQNVQARGQVKETYTDTELARKVQKEMKKDSNFLSKLNEENNKKLTGMSVDEINEEIMKTITDTDRLDIIKALKTQGQSGGYKKKSKSKRMTSKKTSMKVAKKTSSKEKENKNKNKKIVKSYSKSKSKKQSGGFIRGGVLFPQDFYDTSTVM